jgi:hypothetical protein
MLVKESLSRVKAVEIPENGFPVELTVAGELCGQFNINEINRIAGLDLTRPASLQIAVVQNPAKLKFEVPAGKEWVYFKLNSSGSGQLLASKPNLLYSFFCRITEELQQKDVQEFASGRLFPMTFKWHRPNLDMFVSNYGRVIRKLDLEVYARELARTGYTHWEVNSLASPMAIEEGSYFEVYPRFYTYAAGLDQFVESRLNEGTYPVEYLEANLNKMKKMAEIGLRYGITPGMQSFEPRSMPEKFFQRYPFLRGPRVDHPFRSQRPRFALTLVHPVAREHYVELMENIMKAVPQMGFLKIVSNDSGAGLEFTKSLYVGANGGPYLIREWNPDREIAKLAAQNAFNFLKLLRDAATPFNPEFRVLTHLEPLYSEREFFIEMLEDRIDIEGSSFLGIGWMSDDAPYHHPKYPEVKEIIGSALHTELDSREMDFVRKMNQQQVRCHFSYSHGFANNSEPLLGIPFPWLTYEKLKSMAQLDVDYLGHANGLIPPTHARWYINQEVLREMHFQPDLNIDDFVKGMAARWVGATHAPQLVQAWKLFEAAYRGYPPVYLYSGFGHSWYKLWTRPIVPDIEKISEADRAYYEKFMLTTPHNPTRVDLNRDVMFKLMTPDYALRIARRIDANVYPSLDQSILVLTAALKALDPAEAAFAVFRDQYERMVGFKCWVRTLRNVAAWIAGVHTFLQTAEPAPKAEARQLVHDLVVDEIQNAQELLALWSAASSEFMMISDIGETTFIYGENFGQKVQRKIELMQGRENDEPFIDPDFMWRVPGYEFRYKDLRLK